MKPLIKKTIDTVDYSRCRRVIYVGSEKPKIKDMLEVNLFPCVIVYENPTDRKRRYEQFSKQTDYRRKKVYRR